MHIMIKAKFKSSANGLNIITYLHTVITYNTLIFSFKGLHLAFLELYVNFFGPFE